MKRTQQESTIPASTNDLNKKRKLSEQPSEDPEAKPAAKKEEKPWEGKEEQEVDARWDICENC